MKNNITMKEIPESEQPYEKCEKYGPQYLSDGELLSVIIRTGSHGKRSTELAQEILCHLPGQTLSGLYQISYEQLCDIRGIGKVKAIQLLCLTEIAKRLMQSQQQKDVFVCSEPSEIAAYCMPSMRFLETEQVRLLILNGKNRLVKDFVLSSGSFNSAPALPREIFYYALKHKAVSIIVLHNHPSGDPNPSREDMMLTRRIAETGKIIGIPLLDHIIIGNNRYSSMRESGYLS
ncbi:MAG: DNA repair protein RadC [Butyribacter sp.]|nr:DNA repair protein RadC [bacterium]MDY3853500.1 DNA repair protein RadC [Butyribacter sp.]